MKRFLQKKNIIFILIGILAIYRLTLIDKGTFAFYDETRYVSALNAVQKVFELDFAGFCFEVSNTDGRPGDVLTRIPPAFIQCGILKTTGIPLENPHSLLIPVLFNVVVSLLISFVFYQIILLLFNADYFVAIIGTTIFSLLVTNNLYIRHILPYDTSLLLALFILCFLLSTHKKNASIISIRSVEIIGFLAGFQYSIYPGHYYFVALFGTLIFFLDKDDLLSKDKIKKIFCYGLAISSVLLFFQALSMVGNNSFIAGSTRISQTITQGSFEEGLTFIGKYLLQVEKPVGYVLLAATLFFIILSIVKTYKHGINYLRNEGELNLIVLIMLVGYIFHGSLSTIFHKMVFHGRIIHIYFPFIVLATLAIVEASPLSALQRRGVYYGLTSLSIISFTIFNTQYYSLAYPRDVLYDNGINIYTSVYPEHFVTETPMVFPYYSPPPLDSASLKPYTNGKFYSVVNSCFFYPVYDQYIPYKPNPNEKLVFEGEHFLGFLAYSYEGHNIHDRNLLQERKYKVKIYTAPPSLPKGEEKDR